MPMVRLTGEPVYATAHRRRSSERAWATAAERPRSPRLPMSEYRASHRGRAGGGRIDGMELDFERCYRARRQPRRAVRRLLRHRRAARPASTAGRPARRSRRSAATCGSCPSAAAAQRAGFRACLRCRPDAAPGSPEWNVRADVVGPAMRLIADGVVDRDGVPGLADRLGYTERHLHRMLTAELGAGPLALARAQRAQTARVLIETTDARPRRGRVRGRVRQRAPVQRHDPRDLRPAPSRAARQRPTRPADRPARSRCGCRTGRRCTPRRCSTSSARGPIAGRRRAWTTTRTGASLRAAARRGDGRADAAGRGYVAAELHARRRA